MNEKQLQAYQEMKDYYMEPHRKEVVLANSQLADLWQEKRRLEGLMRGIGITAQEILDDLEQGDYERAANHARLIRDAVNGMFTQPTATAPASEPGEV